MSDPIRCNYCGDEAKHVKGDAIYPHRPDLYDLNFWRCKPCEAYVGCHKGTAEPLGRLANAELRRLKSEAHKAFDPLWLEKGGSKKQARTEAYQRLAVQMGLSEDECHIGMFSEEQCRKVIELCRK